MRREFFAEILNFFIFLVPLCAHYMLCETATLPHEDRSRSTATFGNDLTSYFANAKMLCRSSAFLQPHPMFQFAPYLPWVLRRESLSFIDQVAFAVNLILLRISARLDNELNFLMNI